MELTEFLLARIAEDEETARAADGPRWFHHDKVVTFEAFGPDGDWVDASSPISVDTRANGWHIVRWSPARVLAECEAKRKIVERYLECVGDPNRWGDALSPVLDALVQPYADHPDFREEWRA